MNAGLTLTLMSKQHRYCGYDGVVKLEAVVLEVAANSFDGKDSTIFAISNVLEPMLKETRPGTSETTTPAPQLIKIVARWKTKPGFICFIPR